MSPRAIFAVCTLVCILPLAGYGQVWDFAADFSGTQNPNGAWSYGWRDTPNDPMLLLLEHDFPCFDVNVWNRVVPPNHEPCVVQNPNDYPVSCFTWTLDPHKAFFHPGPTQQCVVRWTAPAALDADLAVHFVSIDFGSKIVHVYHNQTELFTATLDDDDTAEFFQRISFQAGDVLDCAIDPISFVYDATQLDVRLVESPTPVYEKTWGSVKEAFR